MCLKDTERNYQNNYTSALEETLFYKGTLKVFQPRQGYRFGIDAMLLAQFLEIKKNERVLEVGAGTGIISFLVLIRFPQAKLFLLEIDPLYTEALKRGIQANQFEERTYALRGDITYPPFKANSFDVLFANPPYFRAGSGRTSPYFLENLARRETFTLKSFLKSCAKLLKNRGRFYAIFTASRLAEFLDLLREVKLEPKVLRLVHSYPGDEARLFLVKALKGVRQDLRILAPLYIYQGKNLDYTEEVKRFYGDLNT